MSNSSRRYQDPIYTQTAVSNGRQELVSAAYPGKGSAGAGFGTHEFLKAALDACINKEVCIPKTLQLTNG
jgi:hypothetical protein